MADRQLSLSLACESYSTGSSYTIAYSEERSDPELTEFYFPEGDGAVRTFYCAWADRFNFVENLLGFARVNAAGTNGVSADGFGTPDDTSYSGRHVHRKLPFGYHMGLTDSSTPPVPTDWVYAVRVPRVSPDGAKSNEVAGSTMSVYEPKAQYAKVEVHFAGLDYDLKSDADVFVAGSAGSGTIGCCREWLRYAKIVQKPASIFFQYPSPALVEVGYPSGGVVGGAPTTKQLSYNPNVLDNIADFWVYIYDLPYDPICGVNYCFGKVNKNAIFATPDFLDGQPAESLHLISADIVRTPLRRSRRYWNLQLGFRKVFNHDYDGTTFVGHNYVRDVVTNGANKQLRFYRVCSDPKDATTQQNTAMIPIVDFHKLFWIPSASIP